jgi:formylglycine-generating enzyme required for sulfatase activity
MLEPFALAGRLVSNGEWEQFIADGGYRTASLWLADGWDWVRRKRIEAPLYWYESEHFTHAGWQLRDPWAPVAHISYFEADAYADVGGRAACRPSSSGKRSRKGQIRRGNQLDRAARRCRVGGARCSATAGNSPARLPALPALRPGGGAVGEYNGKFMAGQWVLKGASCATVRGHSRASYRNFFYPHQRWQFTGLRLAKDL